MARPQKRGLDYFPFDVDYHDDFKIMDLMNKYGPMGCKIFEIILCMVYKNGYYLDVSLEKLATQIIRTIGNRWIKDKNLVLRVIQYCAEIGLFDNDLLTQSVITSVGIQRRYSEVTVRNKVDKSKYWLLEKENRQAAVINAPENGVSVTKTGVSATETGINVAEMPQKKRKENKSKVNMTPAGIGLPLSDGQTLTVTEEEIFHFENLYSDVNVRKELVGMRNWLEQNPNGRRSVGKTKQFIERWLYRRAKGDLSNGEGTEHPDKAQTAAATYQGGVVL